MGRKVTLLWLTNCLRRSDGFSGAASERGAESGRRPKGLRHGIGFVMTRLNVTGRAWALSQCNDSKWYWADADQAQGQAGATDGHVWAVRRHAPTPRLDAHVPGSVSSMMVPTLSVTNAMR